MVHRPNLGGDSIFLHHGPLGQGVVPVTPTHTHTSTWFFCPFAMVGDEWEGEGSIQAKIFRSSSHELTICAIAYDGL